MAWMLKAVDVCGQLFVHVLQTANKKQMLKMEGKRF